MGEVIELRTAHGLEQRPDRVLSLASEAELAELVVVGFGPSGLFLDFTHATPERTLFLLDRARREIMDCMIAAEGA